jgi:hypothetical protein
MADHRPVRGPITFGEALDGGGLMRGPEDVASAIHGAGEYFRDAFTQLSDAIARQVADDPTAGADVRAAVARIKHALDTANQMQYLATGQEILPGTP